MSFTLYGKSAMAMSAESEQAPEINHPHGGNAPRDDAFPPLCRERPLIGSRHS